MQRFLIFRSLTKNDCVSVAKCANASFGTHEIMASNILDKMASSPEWIARSTGIYPYDSSRCLGYVIAHGNSMKKESESEIDEIAVHPDFQRQGIATKLLQHTLNVLRHDFNPQLVYWDTQFSENRAHKLFRRNGFKFCTTYEIDKDNGYDEFLKLFNEKTKIYRWIKIVS